MRSTVLRVFAAVLAGGLLSLSTASCRSTQSDAVAADPGEAAPATATPEPGGRLVYGIESDPNGLDPTRNAFDPVGIQLANALYDPISAFDKNGNVQPYLARAFEPSSDFKTWKVHLRDGIRFHDGVVLDAEAALSWVEAVRSSAITKEAARYITEVTADGDLTIVVTMSRPWATFPALLTGQGGYVMSPNQVTDMLGHSRPVGTGPFKLDRWDKNVRISMVKNPDYWREGLPYLDAVDFDIEPDGIARLNGLTRGTIDVTSVTNVGDVRELKRMIGQREAANLDPLNVEHDTSAKDKSVIVFNTMKAPFDDIRARQAVAHATDVKALAGAAGWSDESLATGPFEQGSPYYVPTEPPGYDLAKAKQLVKEYEAAHKKPLSFEVIGLVQIEVLQLLVAQWSEAGITAKLSVTSFMEGIPRAVGGMYDAIQFRYFAAEDPDILWHFFVSETIKGINDFSLNFTRFGDEEIDKALEAGRATNDPAVRKEAYAAVQRRFAETTPYLWLAANDWYIVSAPRVRDARNVTMPDEGLPALPLMTGTHRLTETWIEQ
jgi:peptide/nickel transport system substrate-binding protein